MGFRQFLSAKLHRGTVTKCDLHYEGSCGLGPDLIKASGILPFEKVSVLNVSTGHRLETYVIPARAKGEISLNGAAARHATVGDKVIILAFAIVADADIDAHRARVVILDDRNKITSARDKPVTRP